jgi:hypothetical protein
MQRAIKTLSAKGRPVAPEPFHRYRLAALSGLAQQCRCRANNWPCDGVIAGGICDMVQQEELLPNHDDDE